MKRIDFLDTTLRDGMQAPYVGVDCNSRANLARAIAKTGPDVMEIGFAANPVDRQYMPKIVRSIRPGIEICGLARLVKSDIDATYDVLEHAHNKRVHVFVGTSEYLLKYGLKKSRDEVLQMVEENVSYARNKFAEGTVQFSAEDATRTDPDYLSQVIETAMLAGADVINIPDTVGVSTIEKYCQLTDLLSRRFPDTVLSAHVHDDRSLADAISYESTKHGIGQVEGTIGGLGERAGNANWPAVVQNIWRDGGQIKAYMEQFQKAYHVLKKYAQSAILECMPAGGRIHRTSSGTHLAALANGSETYYPVSPKETEGKDWKVVLGQTTGSKGVHLWLEKHEIDVPENLAELTRKINFYCAEHRGRISRGVVEEMASSL